MRTGKAPIIYANRPGFYPLLNSFSLYIPFLCGFRIVVVACFRVNVGIDEYSHRDGNHAFNLRVQMPGWEYAESLPSLRATS